MSDPLNPVVEGSLEEMGLGASRTDESPYDELDEIEEAAAKASLAEPEEAPQEPAPVQEEPPQEEGEPEEAPPEKSILELALEEAAPTSEESELTKALQKIARLEGAMDERQRQEDAALRGQAIDEPEPDSPDLLQSQAVQAMLEKVQEETPEQYVPTLMKVVAEAVKQQLAPELDGIKAKHSEELQTLQQQQQNAGAMEAFKAELAEAKAMGGLHEEIVDNFLAQGPESYLAKAVQRLPDRRLLQIPGYPVDLISGLAARLQAGQGVQPQQSTVEQAVPVSEASAGTGGASRAGVSLGQETKQMSEEDKIAEAISNAGGPGDNIPFFAD